MQMESQVIQVNIDDIIPNRFQPRLAFDDEGLKELANSIKEHGIIQPLVLRKLGSKYEIIAGERRYKASQMAGLTTVPAVISNIDDNKSAEIALVENIQRRDLTPIEEARSYKALLNKGYLTQEQLAEKMGISQSSIANKLRLLNLDDSVQQALLEGKISERHARSLLVLDNKEDQKEWLNRIITDRMTVRQLDLELKKLIKDKKEDNNIALVNINPDVEEIKNNAMDLNPASNRNVANMMVPEDVLTDYSENVNNNNVPVETLNQTPTEIPNEPINKFFNILEESPANISNQAFSNENTFTVDNNPFNFNDNLDQVKPMEILGDDPVVNDTITPTTEPFNFEDPLTELNPNNKFFTPTKEPEENQSPLNSTTPLFDPMSILANLDSTPSSNINNSITTIKDTINSLKAQGVNISYKESDLPNNYQITITIEK